MNISGLSGGIGDVLSSVLTLTTPSHSKIGASDSVSFSGDLTISQIRDKVDKLALSGQLTTEQQRALIASGFQDLNAADPSYQPAEQTGYTRLTSGTFNVVRILQSEGEFAKGYSDAGLSGVYSGLVDLSKGVEHTSDVDVII